MYKRYKAYRISRGPLLEEEYKIINIKLSLKKWIFSIIKITQTTILKLLNTTNITKSRKVTVFLTNLLPHASLKCFFSNNISAYILIVSSKDNDFFYYFYSVYRKKIQSFLMRT